MSYCRTLCGKHFIWGANADNECITYQKNEFVNFESVTLPHRIDDIAKEKCGISEIKEIYPGYFSTQVIGK